MLSLCTWNIRGLNDPSKVTEVKKLVSNYNIKLIAILETRVRRRKFQDISRKFGRHWDWVHNYEHSEKGRIWLGWQPGVVKVRVISCHEQVIHCEILDHNGDFLFNFSAVYGLHTLNDRKQLWGQLARISGSVGQCPWLVSGGFNSALDVQDRVNGAQACWDEIKDFVEFIDTYKLFELRSRGHFYSWHKGGDINKTASRIDRCFGNEVWMSDQGSVCSEYLNASISDHSPILITCIPEGVGGGRPFRFFNFLADHADFLQTVETGWREHCHGTAMFSV